ncbi:MAG: ABC transporter permease [Gemmatimonadaceae bacterium]
MHPRDIRAGVRRLFRLPLRTSAQVGAEADEELRSFVDERIDDLVSQGLARDDAHVEALRRLGTSIDAAAASLHTSAITRERRMHVRETVATLRQDLHYALRTLRHDVGFTAFAVAIVALGIGASATVFSVADALLLRPLPFNEPGRLAWIQNGTGRGLSSQTAQVNPFLSLVKENHAFSDVAGYFAFFGVGDMQMSTGTGAIRLSAVPVTQNFFPLLGVHPSLGRGFTAEESAWNGPKAAMISHPLWERYFASDARIIGHVVSLNGTSTTIVGVLPATFDFGSVFAPGARIDLFTPFPLTPETNRWGNTLAMIGRLKPGATFDGAAADIKALSPRITKENANANSFTATLSPLRDHVSGRTRQGLVVLALAVAVVMLIVCANLSNLLLARATTRQKEMAIRAALGAGRGRLVRQMLTESIALSSCGAAIGAVLAAAGTRAIAHMNAVSLPLLSTVSVDAKSLGVIAALAVAAGLAFGMVPALQISDAHVHEALKASGRSATDGRRGQWLRRGLVILEIALACVLLVGSGLLVRSFLNVLDVDLGFRPDRVVAVRVDGDDNAFKTDTQFVAYVDEVLRLARQIPGVSVATIADGLPLGSNRSWGITAGGADYVKGKSQGAFIRVASDGFVAAMGMRILSGRDILPSDVKPGEPVVVINQAAANALWPGQSALGKMLKVGNDDRRVIGIVGDVRNLALEESAGNEVYLPIRQVLDFSTLTLIVRTSVDPAAFARTLRTALAPAVPNLATNEVQTLQGAVDKAVSPRKFFTELLGGFSAFALCLALLGIYGVISYTVTHRTQEIGVRIALGASARQVQGQIMRETIELAVAGIAVGAIAAWLAGRTLSGFLFGVTSADPLTYAGMVAVLSIVAIVSGWVPARRASRIDPIIAIREG